MSERRFPETHWGLFLALGNSADPEHLEAMNRLLKRYWKPVYHYVRATHRSSAQDAEDLTQGFFAMLLQRVDFSQLSPERGTFRGFLKTALRRFIAGETRTGDAKLWRETAPIFAFDEAEAQWSDDAAVTPEDAFDRTWAREVLREALGRLERELAIEGKQVYFEIFRRYSLEPHAEISYESLAAEYKLKPDDVRNYLRAVRGRGVEIIKSLVGAYLFPGESLEDELRFVFDR